MIYRPKNGSLLHNGSKQQGQRLSNESLWVWLRDCKTLHTMVRFAENVLSDENKWWHTHVTMALVDCINNTSSQWIHGLCKATRLRREIEARCMHSFHQRLMKMYGTDTATRILLHGLIRCTSREVNKNKTNTHCVSSPTVKMGFKSGTVPLAQLQLEAMPNEARTDS